MRLNLQGLRKNQMIKTSLYTGVGTVIGQVSGIVVVKIIAVTLGTAGVAIVSQFIDFITMSTSVASGGIPQGVVKYVAEFKKSKEELAKVISTALRITLISTLSVGLLIFLFTAFLSNYLFNSDKFQIVLRIFSLTIVLFGLNSLLIRILNGIGDIKKLVLVNISSSLFGLLITSTAAYYFGIFGALIALSISQSVIFFISLLFIIKSDWYEKTLFNFRFDYPTVTKLLAFTLMGICTMVLGPLINIGIRNYIINHLSIQDAGLWSGMQKISNSYLGIITVTLSYYYLPKLSSLSDRIAIRKEILQGEKIILPFLMALIIIIFLFREQIILLIYTHEFINMKYLFWPQLLGDFFKISSFLLSYLMLAKAKTKMYILTSLIFAFATYFLSIFMIDLVGLNGVVYSYATIYCIYLFIMIYLLREYVYAK